MTTIKDRLRDHENEGVTGSDRFHLRNEAADRIDTLEAALREIKRLSGQITDANVELAIALAARKALEE